MLSLVSRIVWLLTAFITAGLNTRRTLIVHLSGISRPQSFLAGSRRPNGHPMARPATSLDTHQEEDLCLLTQFIY